MRRIQAVVMMLCTLSFIVIAGAAPVSLPFSDDFESGANGVPYAGAGWVFEDADAVVTNNAFPSPGLALYSEESTKLPIAAGFENVWFHCYAIISPFDSEDPEPDINGAAAAFYVTDEGVLMAYSNDTFVAITASDAVSTNDWVGFSVQLDFDNALYNIYMTGASHSHGDALDLVNTAGPLVFNEAYDNSAEQITEVEVSGATFLDTVLLTANGMPLTGGQPGPALVRADTSGFSLKLDDLLSGVGVQYFDSPNMNSAFGNALAALLTDGDKVTFYFNGTGTSFTLTDSAWLPADSFPVEPYMGMNIELLGAGTRRSEVTLAFDNETTHVGGQVALGENWHLLTIPMTASGRTLDQLGLPAANFDRLFLAVNGNWQEFIRHPTGWIGRFTGQPRADALAPGTGFWFQKRSDGSQNWNYGDL